MNKMLVLHDTSGDLLGINVDCIEVIGKWVNNATFIMPKVGNAEQPYLVSEEVDEVLALLQDFSVEMRTLQNEEGED